MGSAFRELSALALLAVPARRAASIGDGIERSARDAIRLSEQLGESWVRAYLLQYLAVAMLRSGDEAQAEAHARASLALRRDLGDLNGMATATDVLASIAIARGAPGTRRHAVGCRKCASAARDPRAAPTGSRPSRSSGPRRPRVDAIRGRVSGRPQHGPRPRSSTSPTGCPIRRHRRRSPAASDWSAVVAARTGSGRARRRRSHERPGGGAPVHLRTDRRESRGEHLQQARRRHPPPGRALVREHAGDRRADTAPPPEQKPVSRSVFARMARSPQPSRSRPDQTVPVHRKELT